ncbi:MULTISPECIES: hypothetical protein [unclassified Leifsonia]|uniref:hypothetical protein n=1 Tax=unclassified Leifsonia TaxID=2663824 RepID=UPI0008A73304|nr:MULTISPECIES: hypothetical protein [unclassified Leifsonia]SEH56876.1 hypothetical protein SAMN04515694_101145 [Leifsonia sp. CL154]SFL21971.1 hypothetical protein SAMN04515692_101334 [Leifsonia sp. CL147]
MDVMTKTADTPPGDDPPWVLLRAAIAEDLIEKLPRFVPLVSLTSTLHVPTLRVALAIRDGSLTVRRRGAIRYMDTLRSKGFLANETSIRLPLPQGGRPFLEGATVTLTIHVPREIADNLAIRSAESGMPREDIAAGILSGALRRDNRDPERQR